MQYNATYYINAQAFPAVILLQKNKLIIQLVADGAVRKVYWQYERVHTANAPHRFVHEGYPPQQLEVLDEAFSHALLQKMHKGKKSAANSRRNILAGLLAAFLGLVAVVYFFIVPWSANALAAKVPEAYERKLGDAIYEQMQPTWTRNEMASALVTDYFNALEINARHPVRITVVDGNALNAFALPGGHIVIYDTLLHSMTSHTQLAALLAHEWVHVQNRHSLKALFREASTGLFWASLVGDASAFGNVIIQQGSQLKALSYSRSLEREADAEGLQTLMQRGFDQNGFAGLFQLLQHAGEDEAPEWTGSHPQLQNRMKAVKNQKNIKQQYNLDMALLKTLFEKAQQAH